MKRSEKYSDFLEKKKKFLSGALNLPKDVSLGDSIMKMELGRESF